MSDKSPHIQCRYVIDQNARIVRVDDNWSVIAQETGSDLESEEIVGRSIFDFIADRYCQDLYKALITKVSHTGEASSFPFRCDTPSTRRLMELRMSQQSGGEIEFEVELLAEDERPYPASLLDTDRPTSEDELMICSWCKCVQVDNDWLEVEDAIDQLGLSESKLLPCLNHVVCDLCEGVVKEQIGSESSPATDSS